MTREEIAEAVEALTRWFETQGIEPEDAVPVMVGAMCFAIHSIAVNPEAEKKGRAIAAKMLKEA